MKFAGKAWKLLVGIKDGLVLLFMLAFFGGLYAALSASPYKDSAARGALRLDLSGAIVEQPAVRSPFDLVGGSRLTRQYRVSELVHALDAAATDDRIQAVALDLDIFIGGGQTAIADVGAALDRFRRANKRVVAYATGYGDDGYQLAAHADEIWLDPLGAVLIAGPGSTHLYYAGLLQRLGVTANVYRVGAFKSAVEPFTRSDMSPEARENAQALANALWGSWQQDVHQARPRAQIAAYVANTAGFVTAAGGDMARAALRAGLVDRIGDRTAVRPAHGRARRRRRRATCPAATARSITTPGSTTIRRADSGGRIAVLTVAGDIVDGNAPAGTAGGETIARNLERGLERGDIKALVVRVDSPGGSVTASERIRRAILGARARGHAGRHLDGLGRRLGRLLDLDRRRRHLRRAFDDHRLDRRVRHPAELPGHAAEARARRRRGAHDAALRRARSAARPLAGGQPIAANGGRGHLSALHQHGRAARGTCRRRGSTRSPRAASGTAARRASSASSTGSARSRTRSPRRRGAPISTPPTRARCSSRRSRAGSSELIANMARGDEDDDATRDAFARLSRRPEAMIERAVHDARQLLAGPAIQARCLECPAIAPVPRSGGGGAASRSGRGCISLVWQG